MPPKTKMTPEEVTKDLHNRGAEVDNTKVQLKKFTKRGLKEDY